jgi:hypothetical protein
MQVEQGSTNRSSELPVTREERRSLSAYVRAMRGACWILLLLLALLSQPGVRAAHSDEISRRRMVHVSLSLS